MHTQFIKKNGETLQYRIVHQSRGKRNIRTHTAIRILIVPQIVPQIVLQIVPQIVPQIVS